MKIFMEEPKETFHDIIRCEIEGLKKENLQKLMETNCINGLKLD